MQAVKRHRRTVSSINLGENADAQHKSTFTTFEDTHALLDANIPVSDLHEKQKPRHRNVSDLIEACKKAPINKSVLVEELNLSISYKDPVFKFGKQKQKEDVQQRKYVFKKSNTRQLDAIVQGNAPKSSRYFVRIKPTLLHHPKNSIVGNSSFVTNNLSRQGPPQTLQVNSRPASKHQRRNTPQSTKDTRKLEVKRNFKF